MILDYFNNEMSRRRVRLHGAVLFKGGKVIEEIYRPPYSRSEKTRMYSSSKSVTALAIGKLIGEGRLSLKTKLIDIFKERALHGLEAVVQPPHLIFALDFGQHGFQIAIGHLEHGF